MRGRLEGDGAIAKTVHLASRGDVGDVQAEGRRSAPQGVDRRELRPERSVRVPLDGVMGVRGGAELSRVLGMDREGEPELRELGQEARDLVHPRGRFDARGGAEVQLERPRGAGETAPLARGTRAGVEQHVDRRPTFNPGRLLLERHHVRGWRDGVGHVSDQSDPPQRGSDGPRREILRILRTPRVPEMHVQVRRGRKDDRIPYVVPGSAPPYLPHRKDPPVVADCDLDRLQLPANECPSRKDEGGRRNGGHPRLRPVVADGRRHHPTVGRTAR